jgi:aminopeptidase-like protein
MRTKYWEYPEYHTSFDNLENVVSPAGLAGGFEAVRTVIDILENDVRPTSLVIGEPMLGKRGLYPSIGAGRISVSSNQLLDVWSFCDGTRSAFEIAERLLLPFEVVRDAITTLMEHRIVTTNPEFL